jgi:hypothetical protein
MIRALIIFSLVISAAAAKELIDAKFRISASFPDSADWTEITQWEYSPKTHSWGASKKDGSLALTLMATNDALPDKQATFEGDTKIWEKRTSHLFTAVLSRRITTFKGLLACELVTSTESEGRTIYAAHWMIQGTKGYYYFITVVAGAEDVLRSRVAASFLESVGVIKEKAPDQSSTAQRP